MKRTLNITGRILSLILVAIILLFALATLMGGSYLQTITLVLLALVIVYWPPVIGKRTTRMISLLFRLVLLALLLTGQFTVFKPGVKKSIYLTPDHRERLLEVYERNASRWPEGTRDIWIESQYGRVHVLACGDTANPPLLMIHAASMAAHSWQENLEVLLDHYCVYSVDNIGEGNKSELADPLVYPDSEKEIADHLAIIADSLGIVRSPVFGASNGGYVSMCYAYYYPERVESLALFGPMGLTQLTGGSIMMLSLATLYPFDFIYNWVTTWALGDSRETWTAYGDWFRAILEGTIPSVSQPVPMTAEQKKAMTMPVLLVLGSRDPIVGDADLAAETAAGFPDIRIEIMDSGHLVAVEKAKEVNPVISDFLYL